MFSKHNGMKLKSKAEKNWETHKYMKIKQCTSLTNNSKNHNKIYKVV